jgi:arylsulfatase A-like enzyme
MHFRTHCAAKHKGKSGQGDYNDVMVAHDENIGTMLKKLDDLGIAEDTIVMYSTDNGVYYNICTAMLCRECRKMPPRTASSIRVRQTPHQGVGSFLSRPLRKGREADHVGEQYRDLSAFSFHEGL